MKILWLASFSGNVGDVINHAGFENRILAGYQIECIDKVEIRDYYFSNVNRLKFDSSFADLVNRYDVFVVGGGGFFDLRWECSCSGTTIDFSDEFIDSVHTKVIINSMGYHEFPGETNEQLKNKFQCFIKKIMLKNWLITVRNDGSFERLMASYGKEVANCFLKVPDNAFFYTDGINKKDNNGTYIGLCITNDLFSKEYNAGLCIDEFNSIVSDLIEELCNNGEKILLMIHTPSDIGIVSLLLSNISERNKRNRVIVSSFDASSEDASERIMAYYRQCKCIIGMRFHSVILGVINSVPTIALSGHSQIEDLFHELELSEYCIKLDSVNFKERIKRLIRIIDNDSMVEKYNLLYDKLCVSENEYYLKINNYLQKR